MALTREYRETVLERIKKDKGFTAALFAEAVESLLEGDKETSLSILRDLVHAHITFKRLAEETGFDEKGLHRMLQANGNPTANNLSHIIQTIKKDLHLSTRVQVRTASRRVA